MMMYFCIQHKIIFIHIILFYLPTDPSLTAKLARAIGKATEGPITINRVPTQKAIIKQELASFEATNELGPLLSKVFNALKTIQPTSTESERVFQTSSIFCSKRHARLNDKSVDVLCFRKSYFLMLNKKTIIKISILRKIYINNCAYYNFIIIYIILNGFKTSRYSKNLAFLFIFLVYINFFIFPGYPVRPG